MDKYFKLFIDEGKNLLDVWETSCVELLEGFQFESANSIYRVAHSLKGASKMSGLIKFPQFIHEVEDVLTNVKNQRYKDPEEILFFLLECQKFLVDWLDNMADSQHEDEAPDLPKFQLKINTFKKLELLDLNEVEARREADDSISNAISSKQDAQDTYIRIHAKKLDDLIQQIGELSILHDILLIGKSDESKKVIEFSESIENCNKTIKQIQNLTLSLRMSPLKGLFQKLKRLAIDLGYEQKKKIQIQLVGGEVELDKVVIESISEAMAHVVRNCVDHGLETPEEREKKGKCPQAKILIRAKQTVNGVVIRINDDGAGLDFKKILNRAHQMKLADYNGRYSEEEICNFIYYPGFSTKVIISETSGRGVGMDVVKNVVTNLRGRIETSSIMDKGTEFKFHLPSLLSIFKGMVIKVSNDLYVFPTKDIIEIFPLDILKMRNIDNGNFVYSYRGDSISVISLLSFFSKSNLDNNSKFDQKIGLVTILNGIKKLLVLDEVKYQRNIVYKNLGKEVQKLPGIYGSAILETGEVVLIIDIPSLERYFA